MRYNLPVTTDDLRWRPPSTASRGSPAGNLRRRHVVQLATVSHQYGWSMLLSSMLRHALGNGGDCIPAGINRKFPSGIALNGIIKVYD